MSQKPTLRDVARAANAGVSTVSLALRDDPRIRADTRRHIQEVAAGMGYQTNALVANLMAQLRASREGGPRPGLAMVNVSPSGQEVEHLPTFRNWADSIRERAHDLGYDFRLYRLQEPGQTPAELLECLRDEGIRGLIFAGLSTGSALPSTYEELWEVYPCVVVGMRPTTPPLHFSCNDQYATAVECMHRLVERGYRRPGLVINPCTDAVLEQRFTAGFRAAQAQLLKGNPIPTHPFQPHGRAEFHRWLEGRCPDVIVTLHSEVREWTEAAGLRVPQDIGLAHLDRADAEGDWSGMDQHSYAVGMAAVDLVIGQIHRNEVGIPTWAKCVLNSSSWVDGATTRKNSTPMHIPSFLQSPTINTRYDVAAEHEHAGR